MKSENSLTGKVAAFQKTGGHVPGRVLLTLSQVIAKTSLGRSAIYAAMATPAGSFPRAIKLGNRRVAWLLDDVEAYIDQRLADRRAG